MYNTSLYGRRMETIADRLRRSRERKYASAAEACEKLRWKYPTYAKHENGERGIRVSVAAKYAQAFGVSHTWLLTGRGNEAPDLAPDEIDMLNKYRQVTTDVQDIIRAVLDQHLAQSRKERSVA